MDHRIDNMFILDLKIQFLSTFTGQRDLRRFALFDLSPHEFPQTALCFFCCPLPYKIPITVSYDGANHVNYFRLFRHDCGSIRAA